jgi:hypothetical protein
VSQLTATRFSFFAASGSIVLTTFDERRERKIFELQPELCAVRACSTS